MLFSPVELKQQPKIKARYSQAQARAWALVFGFLSFSVLAAPRFEMTPVPPSLQNDLTTTSLWKPSCPVALSDLRLLKITHYNFDGASVMGEIILHAAVAAPALELFKKLYALHFPFNQISTLVDQKGDVVVAQRKNVSYGFFCAKDSNGAFPAAAYGKVITINPVENPTLYFIPPRTDFTTQLCHFFYFVPLCAAKKAFSGVLVLPEAAVFSVNRDLKLKGMSESVTPIFEAFGFKLLSVSPVQLNWSRFVYAPTLKSKS